MPVNNIINQFTPEAFFGLKSIKGFTNSCLENSFILATAMQEKLKFTDLGVININSISNLCSDIGTRPQMLSEFKESGLAKLTLISDIFENSLNTHTIGLVINQNPNEYFYKTPEQIIILDSLGEKNPEIKEIHSKLKNDFIKKAFPNAEIITSIEPQQVDGSLSCLNWTLANLEVAKNNLGKIDILNKLPKSTDIDSILEKQQIISQNYRKK